MGHAILSPSASGRWLQCPASVRMTRDLPTQVDSIYAREGTQFHTLCEITVRYRLLGGSREQYEADFLEWALETEDEWQEDQLRYVEEWVSFVDELLDEEPDADVYLEVRVDTSVPGSDGTADLVIVYNDRVRVVDIKYGKGLKVSALGNSQARLYGAGALYTLIEDPLKIREITNTIWQPRMNNLSEETLTRSELLKWLDEEVRPTAKLALTEDAPFGPSEDACRYCPIAGECAPRARYMLAQDFGDPDILDGEELADAYSRTSELKQWIADIEDVTLKRAYEEAGSVPGYKVVQSGGRRGITDEQAAIQRLVAAGYDRSKIERTSIQTLGVLDKVAGSAEQLQEVLGGLLRKSDGRLSVAPESDSRPPADAIHSALTDFAEIIDEGDA